MEALACGEIDARMEMFFQVILQGHEVEERQARLGPVVNEDVDVTGGFCLIAGS